MAKLIRIVLFITMYTRYIPISKKQHLVIYVQILTIVNYSIYIIFYQYINVFAILIVFTLHLPNESYCTLHGMFYEFEIMQFPIHEKDTP